MVATPGICPVPSRDWFPRQEDGYILKHWAAKGADGVAAELGRSKGAVTALAEHAQGSPAGGGEA